MLGKLCIGRFIEISTYGFIKSVPVLCGFEVDFKFVLAFAYCNSMFFLIGVFVDSFTFRQFPKLFSVFCFVLLNHSSANVLSYYFVAGSTLNFFFALLRLLFLKFYFLSNSNLRACLFIII